MTKFDKVNISPSMERLHRAFVDSVGKAMQEYLDESGVESDNFIEGLDVTYSAATELFNDVLLYMMSGEEPPVKVTDPTVGGD